MRIHLRASQDCSTCQAALKVTPRPSSQRRPSQPYACCAAATHTPCKYPSAALRIQQQFQQPPLRSFITTDHTHTLLRFSLCIAPAYVHISPNAKSTAIATAAATRAPSAHCAHPFKRNCPPLPSQRFIDATLSPTTRAAADMLASSIHISEPTGRLIFSGNRGCSASVSCFVLQSPRLYIYRPRVRPSLSIQLEP